MILQFHVSNHLSLRVSQSLSFIAATLKDRKDSLLKTAALPQHLVLPSLLIYGANASGKSNIIAALKWLQSAILFSHSQDSERGIPRIPFALDEQFAKKPTIMSLDFISNGTRYQYGIHATDKAFAREWLYSFPRGRKVVLFERKSASEITFNRTLKGRNRVLSELMRPDSLFLSVAAQNNHELLTQVRETIASIEFDNHVSVHGMNVVFRFNKNAIDPRIIDFLREVGTGVEGYEATERPESKSSSLLTAELATVFKKHLPQEAAEFDFSVPRTVIKLGHKASNNQLVYFDLDRESSGTRRLLVMLAAVFQALDAGTLLVIDEIDASLHTQICEHIVALFSNPKINKKGAQLLATTHDTNLMRSPALRRDQLWFTEKRPNGETFLYPLTDIHTRATDNIEKGYLQGRYGAVPLSGALSGFFQK